RLLGERTFGGPLGVGEAAGAALSVLIPPDVVGARQLLLVSDATNQVRELDGEANNTVARALSVQMAPYADLAVSGVTAPGLLIGDPATLTVSWTVTNTGTGRGLTPDWTDVVYASTDTVLSSDDIKLGTFPHTGGLDQGAAYTQSKDILLPPAFTGRYHI